jgi:hypothetical protein
MRGADVTSPCLYRSTTSKVGGDCSAVSTVPAVVRVHGTTLLCSYWRLHTVVSEDTKISDRGRRERGVTHTHTHTLVSC